jgi:enoyl-CoA hydratase/carnithine racemase
MDIGQIRHEETADAHIERVVISHPGKHNAISVAMWGELQRVFETLQARPAEDAPRVVMVCGEGEAFAAGADISEFPRFRFQEASLRAYHEATIAPALDAVLACDIPLVAQITGPCVGGGLEIAACCDLRIGSPTARFGAPIGRLGFPMAPGELERLARIVPTATLREMLLEGRLLNADEARDRGLIHRVAADVAAEAWDTAQRIAAMSTMAARRNKQTLRQLAAGGLTPEQRQAHFDYAGDAQHREGIAAFLEGRPPAFSKR